jgi:hypothetical protein
MGEIPTIATVIISILSSSVIATIVANRATYKSIAVQAITEERIEWLDELRKIAEDFSFAISEVRLANLDCNLQRNTSEYRKLTREVDRIYARLLLQLGPEGEQEEKIIEAARKLISAAEKPHERFRELEKDFMHETRILLKQEWKKAKNEAGVK